MTDLYKWALRKAKPLVLDHMAWDEDASALAEDLARLLAEVAEAEARRWELGQYARQPGDPIFEDGE